MREKEFLEFIASIMRCNAGEISMQTSYGEFDKWDSVMHLNLIMETEEKYGISIPIERIHEIRKLSDLYGYVK